MTDTECKAIADELRRLCRRFTNESAYTVDIFLKGIYNQCDKLDPPKPKQTVEERARQWWYENPYKMGTDIRKIAADFARHCGVKDEQ